MKRLFTYLKKKRFLIAGALVLLLTAVFWCLHIGIEEQSIHAAPTDFEIKDRLGNTVTTDYKMTRDQNESLRVNCTNSNFTMKEYKWEIPDALTITLDKGPNGNGVPNATKTQVVGTNAVDVNMKAVRVGKVGVTLTVIYDDYTTPGSPVLNKQESFTIQVEAPFSVYSELAPNSPYANHTKITKIKTTDTKESLLMEADGWIDIGNTASDNQKLSLVVGDAQAATWSSSNTDIVEVSNNRITAKGAGKAILTYEITDGGTKYTNDITVYVKPKVMINGDDVTDTTAYPGGVVTVQNGDYIYVDNARRIAGLDMGDRVEWAIGKSVSGPSGPTTALVQDCKKQGAGEAELIWNANLQAYRLKAKAGSYTFYFYPAGTYDTYEKTVLNVNGDYVIPTTTNDLDVHFFSEINSRYQDYITNPNKIVTVTVGGTISLPDLLNISLADLGDGNEFVVSWQDPINDPNYLQKNNATMTFTGLQKGTAIIHVSRPDTASTVVPGTGLSAPYDEIDIKVNVIPAFSLNYSSLTMAQNQKITLMGVLEGTTYPDGSIFRWESTDTTGSYISLDPQEDVAYVEAKKATPDGNPVTVTMYWTDDLGITMSASCKITVSKSLNPIPISKSRVIMNTGDEELITVTGMNTEPNPSLIWISSDEEIVTVEEVNGSIGVKLVAKEKTGNAIVTVINPANNACATCFVTVNKPMTELDIYQGSTKAEDTLTIEKGKKFVEFTAVPTPADATSIGVVWSSSNPAVATIEADEKNNQKISVNLLSAGTTVITVASTNNKTSLNDTITLTVTESKITKIELPEKEINICVGDKYTVVPKLTPANPDDATLTWTSSDPAVATVDGNGQITGVKVGSAAITVSGGTAEPVSVMVNVKAVLQSIAFDKTNIEMEKNTTYQLNVTFTPSEDVNKTLHFSTTDASIADVDAKGLITAKEEGMVLITCWAEGLGADKPISCLVTVTKEMVPATDFQINPEEETVMVGNSFTIVSEFTPQDTSDKNVVYESRDESIASVDENGTVTGVSVGTTVITCTPAQNNPDIEEKFCLVTVVPAVKLTLSPVNKNIAKGSTFTIKATVTPEDKADTPMKWTSDNAKIATVSQTGKVKAVNYGVTTITCTLTDYDISATCRVTVAKLKTTLKLDKTSIRINVGQSYTLKKTVTTNASTKPSVVFSSANKKIATVGKSSGKVKGKKVGSTTITAKTTDSVHAKAKCRVIVIRRVTKLKLNKSYATCYVGQTIKLTPIFSPKSASVKKLKWSVEKVHWEDQEADVGEVNLNYSHNNVGIVTGISVGKVYVTARTTDGSNLSARCLVEILEPIPASSIVISQSNITMKRGDKATLAYRVLPSNTSDKVKFASDNKRVAKVSSKGKVTAVGPGTCTVTITTTSGITNTVTVNVVALDRNSITMRQYDTVSLNVFGTSDNITWYSGNNRIATVSGGKVVGRGKGTTYIYAYVNGCKMACKVKVVSVNSKIR